VRRTYPALLRLRVDDDFWGRLHQEAGLVFYPVYILEVNGDGVLARLLRSHVAYSVGRQVGVAILIVGNLELPGCRQRYCSDKARTPAVRHVPLIQANGILNKQQGLIR